MHELKSFPKRGEGVTYEGTRESEESLEEGLEGGNGVFDGNCSLEPESVESNVPVGELVDQSKHSGDNSVQAISWEMEKLIRKGRLESEGGEDEPSISSLTS